MKLPNIDKISKKKNFSLIKEKFKIIPETKTQSSTNKISSFLTRMKEIKEIKIYLKDKFIQKEIDDQFLTDIEKEFAEQYLLKMKIFPTKNLINKILKLCPLKNCDFQLYDETIYINYDEKNVKSLHIFPAFERKKEKTKFFKNYNINNINIINTDKNNTSKKENFDYSGNNTITSSNKNFPHFKFNHLNYSKKNKYNHLSIETSPSFKSYFSTEEYFNSKKSPINKNRNIKINKNIFTNTNTDLLYNREKIDELFEKYRENVTNLQLFSNKKSGIKVDLSPEIIRKKYLSSESNWSNKIFENRGKLSKISTSILSYKNILNNEKYFFDLTKMKNLTKEIIKEIQEPINPQIELIIKDVNYILDNFPFDEFIHIKENTELLNESKETNDSRNIINLNKIIVKNKKEFVLILKTLSSNDSCRIIILLINLIYWIVFGGNNTVQIDFNTKELLYLKLMKDWEIMSKNFFNKTIFYTIYIPLFIIICRIEIENFFIRKYIYLFEEKKNKTAFFKKANAIISEIFDKHGYMNTFNLFCKKRDDEYNNKFRMKNIGNYKNKLYATSNFVELLFRNDTDNFKDENEIKEKEKFIAQHKEKYFSFYLDKMNQHLKRRNLEPIFKIKYKPDEQKEELNILKLKLEENNSI